MRNRSESPSRPTNSSCGFAADRIHVRAVVRKARRLELTVVHAAPRELHHRPRRPGQQLRQPVATMPVRRHVGRQRRPSPHPGTWTCLRGSNRQDRSTPSSPARSSTRPSPADARARTRRSRPTSLFAGGMNEDVAGGSPAAAMRRKRVPRRTAAWSQSGSCGDAGVDGVPVDASAGRRSGVRAENNSRIVVRSRCRTAGQLSLRRREPAGSRVALGPPHQSEVLGLRHLLEMRWLPMLQRDQ